MLSRISISAVFCLLELGRAFAQDPTLVADALDWYRVWGAAKTLAPTEQTCRGQFRGGSYEFRCDPMSVVVSAVYDSGGCSIVNMRSVAFSGDGVRAAAPVAQSAAWIRFCELPIKEGNFEIRVKPHFRSLDVALSAQARDLALASLRKQSIKACTAYFPKVKNGDPFFHVYEECSGNLTSIYEFKIQDGAAASFPQWTYSGKGNLSPAGAGWRLKKKDLWFDVSDPKADR